MECIFISIHLPQLMAMMKSPKYRFPYSKGNGGLSAHKLHREDKIHLANKIVVDGCDSKKVSWEYCLRPDTLRGWIRKVKNGVKLHGNKGRPSALSKEGKEKLVEYCTAGVYNVKYEDFIKKIHELQMEDAASYTKGLSSVKLMDPSHCIIVKFWFQTGQKDGQTDGRTDRQTDRQIDRQTDR